MITHQLPLGIGLKPHVDFESFVIGDNDEAVAALASIAKNRGENFSFVWGKRGCGKSHLLQATVRLAGTLDQTSAYLPMSMIAELSTEALQGLEQLSLICLDDIQLIAGRPDWEEALFHLFNRLRESGSRFIVAADQPPMALPIELPDLLSRLTWGPCYQLVELDDRGRLQALIQAAERHGMSMSEETGRFLLHRMPRDMHSLMSLVERLDQHSLAAQRRLTIPFVREALTKRENG